MKFTDFAKSAITQRIELSSGGDECWIEVRSVGSNEWAEAKSRFDQSVSKLLVSGKKLHIERVVLGQDVNEMTEDYERLFSILIADGLIVDWSFDEDCTLDNSAQFLHNNKAVRSEADRIGTLLHKGESEAKKPQLNQQKENSSY